MDARRLAIDPNNPTKEEIEDHNYKVAAHNHKVAKANLASNIAKKLAGNPSLDFDKATPDYLAKFAISVAEKIIESYSLMPDAAGNKGGLVS